MHSAEQFVAHRVAEQRRLVGIGVANHHRVALVDDVAVDDASVVGGSGATPAAGLDLERREITVMFNVIRDRLQCAWD